MENNFQHWHLDKDSENILWLTLDRKDTKVNSLNDEVITEFNSLLDQIANDESIAGVIIQSAKKTGFIAGADISQFKHLDTEEKAFNLVRQVQQVFDKLEFLTVPTVALINGFCLGGGLELALACDYRVALDDLKVKIGLPEVQLGLQPGWGGTVRLVRLIGPLTALPLMLAGRMLPSRTAAKLGIVDAAAPLRVFKRAGLYYVKTKPKKHQPNWKEKLANQPWLRSLVGQLFYKQIAKKAKKEHYPAPYMIVKRWVADGAQGEKAFINEAKAISELMLTNASHNLIRVFFLQTRMKGLGKGNKTPFRHVHVIGAGTMGGDIAAWCAFKGMEVTLQDIKVELIAKAIKRAHKLFKKKFKKDWASITAAMDRLIPDVVGNGVKQADVVIEAVSENKKLKQQIYRNIEPHLKPNAILATNTSSLPLDDLNQVLKQPERLVGIHFFNPVAMMQLVEVVKGEKTGDEVYKTAEAFVGKIGKLPLPVKSSPGFLVNRVLMPYLLESVRLLEEGVSGPEIDKAAVDFGMPMGPIELADTVGLDVCLSVAEILTEHLGGDVPVQLREFVEKGYLGRKTGRGFYEYNKGKPVKPSKTVSNKSIRMPDNLTDRLVLRMVNEAMACLRETVVEDADLLDAGMIFGTGFAPFRGGPMHYADTEGKASIVERLSGLQKELGNQFKPDVGWE